MTLRLLDDFGQRLVQLRLIEPRQLEECIVQLRPTNRQPDDLLQVLESKNLLTSYQVSRIKKGETDGLVLGDYKLMYRNASGSFARVFRACSVTDGRMVGLKVLRQRWISDRQSVESFHREAEVCKNLRHKNIVPIYEVGTQGDYHYFTMEFVEGGNLRDFITIRKKLSPQEATRCLLDMGEGLEYAFSKGITHRDLKLSNVLMNTRGVAKLVDFGLADNEFSPSGTGAGDGLQRALEYATLERATGTQKNDPRSDLYFLGTIYYELLTGTSPYPRTRSREERMDFSRYRNVRPIRLIDPNCPRKIADILDRLMQLNPNQRYQKPGEVVRDARAALEELGGNGTNGSLAAVSPAGLVTDNDDQRTLPTVMCIENRPKQQDMLRNYLSKRGFRVLVLNDVQRGLSRLMSNPPNCIVLMGEAIGSGLVAAYRQAVHRGARNRVVTVAVLSDKQAGFKSELEQSATARVLVHGNTLRVLRREIHLAFQRLKQDSGEMQAESVDVP